MNNITNLNDLLADTPGMERFTLQCLSLERACRKYLDKHLIFTVSGKMPADEQMRFDSFMNDFMDNNEYDEIGNVGQVIKMAKDILRDNR